MTSTSDTVTEHVATVSYDGGGWTIPYLIGMTAHLQRAVRDFAEDAEDAEATHPPRVVLRFAGVSSGACVALAAALDIPMDDLMAECLSWAPLCRACPLLTLQAVRAICRRMLGGGDAARASACVEALNRSGRFALGVSRLAARRGLAERLLLPPGVGRLEPVVLGGAFLDEEDLIEAVAASCRLPLLNTLPPLGSPPHTLVDGVLASRFFEPPWRSDVIARVSAYPGRAGADICCPEDIPLPGYLVPLEEAGLRRLYDLGVADGPRLARMLLPPGAKKAASGSSRSRQVDDPFPYHHHDRSPRLYERLHVDRRLDVLVPREGADRQGGPSPAPVLRRPALVVASAAARPARVGSAAGRPPALVGRHALGARSVLRN